MGANKKTQVVKVKKSLLRYFEMINNFDNESEEYKRRTRAEFEYELRKALSSERANKEIVWVE